MWAILTLVLASLTASTQGIIVVTYGVCPKIPPQQNFELERYLGKWFTFECFDSPQHYGLSCIAPEYTIKSDGAITVVNTGIRKYTFYDTLVFNKSEQAEGRGVIINQNEPAGLNVHFDGPNDDKINYVIVDTDYDTYSLVYSCTQGDNIPVKSEVAWILTRERGVPPANINDLKAKLMDYKVDTKNFKLVDNEGCNE